MKERKNLVIFVVIAAYFVGKILGGDPDVCKVSPHYIDPEFTCCGANNYSAPLTLFKNISFDDCQPAGSEDSIITNAWSKYNCIIQKQLQAKAQLLSFPAFGELMAGRFPDVIKNKILELIRNRPDLVQPHEIEKSKVPEEFRNLMMIRANYFQIEKKVCSELDGTAKNLGMDDPPKRCYNWMERYHGAGDCCANTPIPFQLSPEPHVTQWTLTNYTATKLMPLAGRYEWKNWTYSNNLMQCFKTARLLITNVIPYDEFKANIGNLTAVDYEAISNTFIPKFFTAPIRQKMRDFMIANITLDSTIKVIMENNPEQFFSAYEFRRYNSSKIRHLYWRCETHKLLAARMKDFDLTQYC